MSAQIHTLKTGDLAASTAAKNKIEQYDTLINNVFNRLNVQLLQRVSTMLNSADSSLTMLSEQAESIEMKSKYKDLMHVLRAERSNIDKAFFIDINDKINSNASSDEDELALVDQDEMEEMVAITTMYSNAMNNYGQEVNNLEARFEYIEMASNKNFADSMAQQLEASLSATQLLRRQMGELMEQSMQQMSLPTRREMLGIAERMTHIEMRLDDMENKLDQVLDLLKAK